MKVEQRKEFQPITITLETEFEARVLNTITGTIAGGNAFRQVTDDLYRELENLKVFGFEGYIGELDSDKAKLED